MQCQYASHGLQQRGTRLVYVRTVYVAVEVRHGDGKGLPALEDLVASCGRDRRYARAIP